MNYLKENYRCIVSTFLLTIVFVLMVVAVYQMVKGECKQTCDKLCEMELER